MSRTLFAVLLCTAALAACDDKKSEEATTEAPLAEGASQKTKSALKTAQETSEVAKEATKAMTEGVAPGSADWEMEVAGIDLPKVSGSSVMATKIGPGAMYQLIGVKGTASINLEGAEKFETGTFKPYNFSLLFPDTKIQCGYSKLNEGKTGDVLEVKIEKDGNGIKGTVEGDVNCRKVDGSDEPKKAKVKGWFKDS